ncbi:MAG TPA: NFACT family protein [Candidatus Norongarragalinales archaeon]|jgi:predicted ribosome quality control (RQC) complex YloA/Tae2 family protein|nr:NFACT family protein [Candidatus Norongarragalinales archaeon]
MSNLDYHHLATELQRELTGGRFNKAYAITPTRLRLRFNKEGERNLIIDLGVRAHLTKYLEEGVEPAGFIKYLREHLDNARVLEVKQLQFDRVLEIVMEKKQRFSLVLEQFAQGNALLLDEKNTILSVLRKEEWASRTLAPGRTYSLPPSGKKLPESVTLEDFEGLKGGVVASLSKVVNIAPYYLEEVCTRAGIDYKKEIGKLSKEEKRALLTAIASLSTGIKATLYHKEFKPFAFAPFHLKKLSDLEAFFYNSFSEALDEYYKENSPAIKIAGTSGRKLEKLEHQLAQQKAALEEFEREEKETRAAGDAIYEKFQLVEGLLKFVREKKAAKATDEEISRELEKVSKDKAKFLKGTIEVEL